MLLHELKAGCTARLSGFSDIGKQHQVRYLSLGLMPGAEIQILRVAPLGCPIQIKTGSTVLSIRKAEAAELLVEDVV